MLATGNPHKVRELEDMVRAHQLPIVVQTPRIFGNPPEIPEVQETFAGNAIDKAQGIATWLREQGIAGATRVLADDSGLCVDAFDGAPGVRSARFAEPPGGDAANNRKLVSELEARGLQESPAHYVCALALVRVDGGAVLGGKDVWTATGTWHGTAKVKPEGTGGFGYDPYIYVPRAGDDDASGEQCAVAKLPPQAKRERSHRGRAMAQLLAELARTQTPAE
ncbi:MAG: non-canonical purine NTP pyrophosphatase [Nannocystaceae bacterium]